MKKSKDECCYCKEGDCFLNAPDSIEPCTGECVMYAPAFLLKGVGKDANVITNEKGGKQSKSPLAMHLFDPEVLILLAHDAINENAAYSFEELTKDEKNCYRAIESIAFFMRDSVDFCLAQAICLLSPDRAAAIINIAKVLQYGANKYEANNWRLIPQEDHINHALTHLVAYLAGDRQDDHREHAQCRLMMALATLKSKDFDYLRYVKKVHEER